MCSSNINNDLFSHVISEVTKSTFERTGISISRDLVRQIVEGAENEINSYWFEVNAEDLHLYMGNLVQADNIVSETTVEGILGNYGPEGVWVGEFLIPRSVLRVFSFHVFMNPLEENKEEDATVDVSGLSPKDKVELFDIMLLVMKGSMTPVEGARAIELRVRG